MSKINHERDVLRQIDQRKRQAAEDRRQAKEHAKDDGVGKSITKTSSNPPAKKTTDLSKLIQSVKHYLTHGDWRLIPKVLSELNAYDADIAMKIIEITLDGVTIKRTEDHASGFWITAKNPAASRAFQEFNQLRLQGKDLKSQTVLKLVERHAR